MRLVFKTTKTPLLCLQIEDIQMTNKGCLSVNDIILVNYQQNILIIYI